MASSLFPRWGHYDRWWGRVSEGRGSQRAGRWLSARALPGQLQLHEPQPWQVTNDTHLITKFKFKYAFMNNMFKAGDDKSLVPSLMLSDLSLWEHTDLWKCNLLFPQVAAHSHSARFPSERRSSHRRHAYKPPGEEKVFKKSMVGLPILSNPRFI